MRAWVLAAAVVAAGCGEGGDRAGKAPAEKAAAPEVVDPNVKPYPLKICLVSGEPLGAMGKPARLVHEGQEIKLCCDGCEKDFRKDPAKYLKKIEDAAKK